LGEVELPNQPKLDLDVLLEQEIKSYIFENEMAQMARQAHSKYEEAQAKYEIAQAKYEEVSSLLQAIQGSRIWRYSAGYRRISYLIKTKLKSSRMGRLILKTLKEKLG
jgi:hypothetical protein